MKLTELQTKQLRLLKETIDYYSIDPNNRRSLDTEMNPGLHLDDANCIYSPHGKSQGCAIGRLIPKALANSFDSRTESIEEFGTPIVKDIFNELPTQLQELGINYLTNLQILHDSPFHWNEEGLTDRGEEFVEEFRQKIMTGVNKFN